jgi:hypothetical protein
VVRVLAGPIDPPRRRPRACGLPAVHGEVVEGDVAGYHYYPDLGWLADAGLDVNDEEYSAADDRGYRHFLLRTAR